MARDLDTRRASYFALALQGARAEDAAKREPKEGVRRPLRFSGESGGTFPLVAAEPLDEEKTRGLPAVAPDQLDGMQREELRAAVSRGLSSLPLPHRIAVSLVHGLDGGPPVPEVELAALFGLTRAGMSFRYRAGLGKMRSALAGWGARR